MATIPHEDIENAFRTLFGPQLTFSEAVLNYIQPSGIKSAYREQVKACHPDLAHQNGRSIPVDGEEFSRLQEAYHLLLNYKNNTPAQVKKQRSQNRSTWKNYKEDNSRKTKKSSCHQTTKYDNTRDFYYSGKKLPSQKLRLGEFLYYSHVISWKTLIDALVYKKKFSDKKLGAYFIDQKILTNNELYRHLNLQQKHNLLFNKK